MISVRVDAPITGFLAVHRRSEPARRALPAGTSTHNFSGPITVSSTTTIRASARDIDKDTELDMRTHGERLIIEPIRGARRAKVKAAAQRAMIAHDATLRELAK